MYSGVYSGQISIDTFMDSIGGSMNNIENQISQALATLKANPDPKPGDLLLLQQQMQNWTAVGTMMSSLIKDTGNIMKTIVNNMGQ